jgi:excisionase family DNA binding protein
MSDMIIPDPTPNPLPWRERLLVDVAMAAEILSVSRRAIYDMLYQGELQSIKRGGSRRITVESLIAYVDAQRGKE